MNRAKLIQYIRERFETDEEYPWRTHPNYAVFRHGTNKKWFALIMDIPKGKLGLTDGAIVDVLNVACDPLLIGALHAEKGFYPAYHMNKSNWISIALDGSVEDEKIKWLIKMSFERTGAKKKRM